MKRIWRIISDFDVEGVILVMTTLTLISGLVMLQVTQARWFEIFDPKIAGAVMVVSGVIGLGGLGAGHRKLVLVGIPFMFVCWLLIIAVTIALIHARYQADPSAGGLPGSAILITSMFVLIALTSAWSWVRILVDETRLDRVRQLRDQLWR